MQDETKDIESLLTAVQGFSSTLVSKFDAEPLAVAGVLAATALSIYKSALNTQEYNSIVDAISDSRDQARTLEDMADTLDDDASATRH